MRPRGLESGRCRGGAGRDQELELIGRDSRAVKVTLGLLAPEGVEDLELLNGLDAFRNRAQAVSSRQGNDRSDDCLALRLAAQAIDE